MLNPSLLWTHKEESRRRDCEILVTNKDFIIRTALPSWSWASWVGPVVYQHAIKYCREKRRQDKSCDRYIPSHMDPEWHLTSNISGLDEDDPIRNVLIQAEVWIAVFDVGPLETVQKTAREFWDRKAHPIMMRGHNHVISFIWTRNHPHWAHIDRIQLPCEFVAITSRKGWQAHSRQAQYWSSGMDGAPQTVDVMMITRRPDGIAYRVAIADILEDDWKAANPTRKHLILA